MRSLRAFVTHAALCFAALGSAGCAPSPADVARLRDEGDNGPDRLAAIVRDAKGSGAVQKDAALALVTLTLRGRHVGLDLLADALAARGATSRAPLVEAISAELTKGMALPRTPTGDPALAHKDGAYLLYSRGLATGASKEALGSALDRWVRESPMDRLDDAGQRYGATSLLHALGPAAARTLSRFFDDDRDYRRALDFVLASGDDVAMRAASVSLARFVGTVRTPAWRESKRQELEDQHRRSRQSFTILEVDVQLRTIQHNELDHVFRALERLADPEAVAALLAAGEDHDLATADRGVALKSLGKRAGLLDDAQIDRVLAIATTGALIVARSAETERAEAAGGQPHYDTDLAKAALTCAAQAPRARPKLLELVASHRSWRLRMEAASTLLRLAVDRLTEKPGSVDEVLARLPARNDVPMALAEITAYGAAISATPEGKAAARAHLGDTSLGARLAALTALRDDRPALEPREKDEAKLPQCSATDECEWLCQSSRVTTVGQYVRECLEKK